MDSIVHGVAKSWTGLRDFHCIFHPSVKNNKVYPYQLRCTFYQRINSRKENLTSSFILGFAVYRNMP